MVNRVIDRPAPGVAQDWEGAAVQPIKFAALVEPAQAAAEAIDRWQNDPSLVPFIRPSRSKQELEENRPVTMDTLAKRLEHEHVFLIYRGSRLIGEMNFQVDPDYLLKKEPGTAWIGIMIGEADERGKGVGRRAMQYLEERIVQHGLRRIELGVFEFNAAAIALYQALGYQQIATVPDFTYWRGRMWRDIRMEKRLSPLDPDRADNGG
jgi:RimJ/RimL family protein N-acetyltransferase